MTKSEWPRKLACQRARFGAGVAACVGGLIVALGLIFGRPAGAGDITVVEAWARATPPGAKSGAAYFSFKNSGAADRLIGATTPAARRPELHTHIKDGGVMRMRPIDGVDIPAGGMAMMAPGGDHVMLMGLAGPLKKGASFPMTLTFERSGAVTIQVSVRGIGAQTPSGHGGHDMKPKIKMKMPQGSGG